MALTCDRIVTAARLDPVAARVILSATGITVENSTGTVEPGTAMILIVAGLLDRSKIVTADQRSLLLQKLKQHLYDHAARLQVLIDEASNKRELKKLPVLQLGFVDRKYVTCDDRKTFLNLDDGEELSALNEAPMETISYNTTTLYVRCVVPLILEDMQNADSGKETES